MLTNPDAKLEVIDRFLEVARMIRKRGTADMAAAVLPYEQQFERDRAHRDAETKSLPGMEPAKAA